MFSKTKIAPALFLLLITVGCRSLQPVAVQDSRLNPVNSDIGQSHSIDSIIEPYRIEYNIEMQDTIGYSGCDMVKGRPEGQLSNLLADMTLAYVKEKGFDADVALLNIGSIRTSLNAGPIVRSEIFEIMPFDNMLVIASLTKEQMDQLVTTIIAKGGDPISGLRIKPDGSWELTSKHDGPLYNVVLTDYVYNGGDNYGVFNEVKEHTDIPVLIRDAWIEYVLKHYPKSDPACGQTDKRIVLP